MDKDKVVEAINFVEDKLQKTALTKQDIKEIDDRLEQVVAQVEMKKKYFKRLGK